MKAKKSNPSKSIVRDLRGYYGITPEIADISFPEKGKMNVRLIDGRIIVVPLSRFPEIKKLDSAQRKKWQVLSGVGFTFDDCDEVYHIEQILGDFNKFKFAL